MLEYWRSSIGKKTIVAVTGTILVAYLILHMAGNLNSIFGPGADQARVDWYSQWLRDFGEPLLPHAFVLWVVRVVLLTAIVTHITGVIQLTARNRAARPAAYPQKKIGRSIESRLMMLSGVLVLAFIVFHILQFTTLTIDITPLEHGAIYANLYNAFQEWYFVVLYVAAVCLVGIHLRHGIWSVAQTLGFDNPKRNAGLRHGATAISLILVIGFALVPVLFITGVLDAPEAPAALLTNLSGAIPGGIS